MSVLRRAALMLAAIGFTASCSLGVHPLGPRPALPQARTGGTLTVGITAPGSLDPSNAFEPIGRLVLSAVCDSLFTFDPVTGNLEPSIAGAAVVSQGGTSFTIQIRKGIRYADGEGLSSRDVVAELNRVASATNASFEAPLLASIGGYPYVHGDRQTNNATARRQMSGLGVQTGRSVTVHLGNNDADFLRTLASLVGAPVPRRLADAAAPVLGTAPVCVGPYQFAVPYAHGTTEITLTRSAHYYGGNNVFTAGGRGYPDTIVFRIYPTEAAEVVAFRAGLLDVAQVPTDLLPTVASNSDLVSAPNGSIAYLGLPSGAPISPAEAAARVALSAAVDRTALNDKVFDGGDLPATGFIAPTVGDAEFRPNACGSATPASPVSSAAAAIALPTKLYTNSDFANPAEASELVRQLDAQLHVHVSVVTLGWDSYLPAGVGPPGFAGAFLESWNAPVDSADSYLYPLFDSSGVGSDNWSYFSNPYFDNMLEQTARHEDGSVQSLALSYFTLERQLCQNMPMIPLLFRQNHFLIRKDLVGSALGTYLDRATGQPLLRELYLKNG